MAALAGVRRIASLDQLNGKIMTAYTMLKTRNIGDLLLVASPTQLTGIYFAERDHAPALENLKHDPSLPVLRQAVAELNEYLGGERATFSVPMHYGGTGFQHEIWNQIAQIPFGETITYTELARRANAPTALRAAGTATGRNPLAIIVPYHRVVGKNGGMGGYAGGVDRKRHLLKLEMEAMGFKLVTTDRSLTVV